MFSGSNTWRLCLGPSGHQKKINRNTPIKNSPAPYNRYTYSEIR